MTAHQKSLVEQAAYEIILVTSKYCEVVRTRIDSFTNTREQMQEIQDSIRTLNHVTCAMERLCRVLDSTDPGKDR